jgi:hypothetical protein
VHTTSTCAGIGTAFLLIVLSACGGGEASQTAEAIRIVADFNSPSTDWGSGFSDYTVGTQPVDVIAEPRMLPQPFVGFGLYTAGTNKSDDLFIYIKKRFSGFAPLEEYSLTFDLQILTNRPSGCAGAGGAPGESVYVKGGGFSSEPQTVLLADNDNYRMNIEGNALVLGNLASSNTDCSNLVYQTKRLSSPTPLNVSSDAEGSLWILFGIDSGFEAASNLYYQSAVVVAVPRERPGT